LIVHVTRTSGFIAREKRLAASLQAAAVPGERHHLLISPKRGGKRRDALGEMASRGKLRCAFCVGGLRCQERRAIGEISRAFFARPTPSSRTIAPLFLESVAPRFSS